MISANRLGVMAPVLAFVGLVAPMPAIGAAPLLYGVQLPGEVVTVDQATANISEIGRLDPGSSLGSNQFSGVRAMAVRPSDQAIFVWNNATEYVPDVPEGSGLVQANPLTGQGSLVGSGFTCRSVQAMAFNSTDNLYGFSYHIGGGVDGSDLVQIDPGTGAISRTIGLVDENGNTPRILGADFAPDGRLFAVGSVFLSTAQELYTMDLSTGQATSIGELDLSTVTPLMRNPDVESIAFDPSGQLIGSWYDTGGGVTETNGGLFDIDAVTGAVSNGRVTNPLITRLDGLGFVGPIPEPETYAMFLTGLGLMGFMVRRKAAAAKLFTIV